MHNNVLQRSQPRDGNFLVPVLRRVVRNWLARRKLRRLETLDDYLLNDIGLTRDDLYYVRRLPRQVDPIAEMAKIREQRIRRGVKAR